MTTKKHLLAIICDLNDDVLALGTRLEDLEGKVEKLEKSTKKAGLVEKRKPGRPKKNS